MIESQETFFGLGGETIGLAMLEPSIECVFLSGFVADVGRSASVGFRPSVSSVGISDAIKVFNSLPLGWGGGDGAIVIDLDAKFKKY
jgi:hypothetical protein